MMHCPKCNREMTCGAPHSEGYAYQWECHGCGYILPVDSKHTEAVYQAAKERG